MFKVRDFAGIASRSGGFITGKDETCQWKNCCNIEYRTSGFRTGFQYLEKPGSGG